MASVTIRGREYPLCLTVAALDDLKARGYTLRDVSAVLSIQKDDTIDTVAERAIWLLSVLIREGEMNRYYAVGDEDKPRGIPSEEVLRRMLTPGQAVGMLIPMMAAVSESMKQDIEAASPKNADQAGQA